MVSAKNIFFCIGCISKSWIVLNVGNIDQVQYTDRMKELVEFMGPKLQEEELSRIWHMAEKASPHVVDNIHRIMAAAATRFNPHQFDHLLSLIRKVLNKV